MLSLNDFNVIRDFSGRIITAWPKKKPNEKLVSRLPEILLPEEQIAGLILSKLTLFKDTKHLVLLHNFSEFDSAASTGQTVTICISNKSIASNDIINSSLCIEFDISLDNLIEECKSKLDFLDSLVIKSPDGEGLKTIHVEIPRRFKHKTLVLCKTWERPYFVDHKQGTDFVISFLDKTIAESYSAQDVIKNQFKEIIAMRRPELLRPFVHLAQQDIKLSVFQTEQMSVSEHKLSFTSSSKSLGVHLTVYDYSKYNISQYQHEGFSCIYLPVETPEKKYLKALLAKSPKDYDFAHVGQLTSRRLRILTDLKNKGYTINIIENKWSLDRDKEIAKCRGLLNIHQTDEHKVFEVVRANRFLGLMPVYSEPSEELPKECLLLSDIPTFDLSILIPTMHSRNHVLKKLLDELDRQKACISYKIEIIVDCDGGQKTVGQKRQDLLLKAKGQYCCFIDDDDIISSKYLNSFEQMISDGTYDCSSLLGSYYSKNKFVKLIRHSMTYIKWSESSEAYLRTTNHINVIRTSIAKQIGFKNLKKGEDSDFSTRLLSSKLLKKEYINQECIYFYIDEVKNIRNFCSYEADQTNNFLLQVKYTEPRILLKMPSRSRPEKLLKILKKYVEKSGLRNTNRITYLISVDDDDVSITSSIKNQLLSLDPNIIIKSGPSKGKIEACNRDMTNEIVDSHHIFMLASDDMEPIQDKWAITIIDKFYHFWPEFDGVVHFNDGYTQDRLDTFCILGREYYKLFNYFYYPEYKSLWCDNEFTVVAKKKQRYVYDARVLFKHEHPANTKIKSDELYDKNDKFFEEDRAMFERRSLFF